MISAARALSRVAAWEAPAAVRCVATSTALRGPFVSSAPMLQAKGKGGKGAGPAGPAFEEKYDLSKQIPVNLLKDGPEPEYQPDSAYPPWVFKLLEEKPLLEDIVMKGMEKVPREQMKSVFRMANKRQIKEANTKRRKE